MSDGIVSNEPVVGVPTPIAVEPRVATSVESAEVARQAEEGKVAAADRIKESGAKATEPVEKPKAPLTTREALRAAAAKVEAKAAEPATPLKTEPVAAPKEAKATEPAKTEAKTAEPAAKAVEPQARGEDGKFASKAADPAAPPKTEPAAKAAEPVAEKPKALPSHTAEVPPARFSAAAKEKWAEAPDEVRSEVTRAVTELTKGFEKHRVAAERDAELTEFHELATKGNTTVKQALTAYVNMENVLRADPIKGLELIAKNAGLSLKDVAAKILNQTPDQAASAADATIRDLTARLERAEAAEAARQANESKVKTDTTTEQVTKFASDPAHSRFEELSDDIVFFMKSGRTKDLAEAYTLAERLNPAPVQPKVEAKPETVASAAPVAIVPTLVSSNDDPAHTRGQKSITGAPTAGSDPVRKQPSSNIKEALRRAAARVG